MSDAAAHLLAYYSPLAGERVELSAASVLYTPRSPLLGANAVYPAAGGISEGLAWLRARGAPPLVASSGRIEDAQEILRLRVGRYTRQAAPGTVMVEQVSRLQLVAFAEVLARSWDLPQWASALGRSLAHSLESLRDFTLLMAYDAGQAVGALLVVKRDAHLWGVTDSRALPALLDAAADLTGGAVNTSCPPEAAVQLDGESSVSYWLLHDNALFMR
ncbi:hypothetical protein [Deinococcus peraridilitoris]|uniref:Uncharacterized protein n=1 Tax=Deinococcus peraridilitoris (strain DSM 19664 / LMG 22246 / CIP 109416 / KR-200) TaxID=937777 RepID=L0A811_DEIPD|nr:hypothetical protein [Deinococcus peraridilitoris]AFZ69185.1 hypothetical protein Deipe_3760 [Deinococcus peraridilitoris DSM 19664]